MITTQPWRIYWYSYSFIPFNCRFILLCGHILRLMPLLQRRLGLARNLGFRRLISIWSLRDLLRLFFLVIWFDILNGILIATWGRRWDFICSDGLNEPSSMLAVLSAFDDISFWLELVNGRWAFVRVMMVASDHQTCAILVPDVASLDVGTWLWFFLLFH